ncbi:hypothetical protein F1880_009901 [Penicillium rolfsii]|nr:hypothetical protein F1880_009901 [Penicillium rolfsii]
MIWTSLLGEVARLYHLLLSEWNTLGDLQIVRREFGFELVQARVARLHNLRPIREFLEISPPKKYTVKRSANRIETAAKIICTRGKGGSTTVYNAVSQQYAKEMNSLFPNNLIGDTVRLLRAPPKKAGSPPHLRRRIQYLVENKVKFTFTRDPAHAFAAPCKGVTALDAVLAPCPTTLIPRQPFFQTQKTQSAMLNGAHRRNIISACTIMRYTTRSETTRTLGRPTEQG